MIYDIQIGKTLYVIDTPLSIQWRKEELAFLKREDAEDIIEVKVEEVDELPLHMMKSIYTEQSFEIGMDENGNEIRTYYAGYLSTRPLCAQSIYQDHQIHIYYLKSSHMWENPNTRIWNWLHMENVLLHNNGLILHCSYMMYKGKAILLSAPSGTGKTTQAKLWEKLFHSEIINGDKCLLQLEKGIWYACGYPYHGSADECRNEKYPILSIVVVRQSLFDEIKEMSLIQQVSCINSEITVNSWNIDRVMKTLDLVTDLCQKVKVIKQHCTMNDQAALTLHHYLFHE